VADIVIAQGGQIPRATKVRYKDMGDETHALMLAALISGMDSDGNILVPLVDTDTKGLIFITHYEMDTHESIRFKASYLQPHGGELANDAVHDFLIEVNASAAHALLRIAAGGNCDLLLYEATTVSAEGTPLASISKNRATIGTSNTVVYDTPTITGVGTLLLSWFVPGGARGAVAGGDWNETAWILAPNTNYLVRVVNRSGNDIQLALSWGWSEH
jgi:hypothetical protein